MKWTIDGVEVEGSYAEFEEWHNKKQAPVREKKPPADVKKTSDKHPFHGSKWLRSEDQVLQEAKSVDEAMRLLPHRTQDSIYNRHSILKRSHKSVFSWNKSRVSPKIKRKGHKASADAVERIRWIGSRARYYMSSFKFGRDRAYVQASNDWRNNKAGPLGVMNPVKETKDTRWKLIKFDSEGKRTTINVFSSRSEAEAELIECKTGSQAIGEFATFIIEKIEV